jgi:uncharacterized membrane protein
VRWSYRDWELRLMTGVGRLRLGIVVLLFVWPVLLAAAATARIAGWAPASSTLVYLVASQVCHQQPDRSFSTASVHWPVCGRCSGLYLAAPLGALAAVVGWRRRPQSAVLFLALAVAPTAVSLAVEWLNVAPVGNVARMISALPLGAGLSALAVGEPSGPVAAIK